MSVVLVSFILLGKSAEVYADGTEALGPPLGITVATGSGIAAGGTGMVTQPGVITVNVPAGAIVKQVLLYWEGFSNGSVPGDDTISVNGIGVTGALIGGPTYLANTNRTDTSFRSDITSLGLITPGLNTLTIDGMSFSNTNNGAGVLVIYDNGSGTSDIQIRDGLDIAYINSPEPIKSTVPQTFNFVPEGVDRIAKVLLFVGGVSDSPQTPRPNSIEISVTAGSITTTYTYSNFLNSIDGPEWDSLMLDVLIPNGATKLKVQVFSRDDAMPASGNDPASLEWVGAIVSIPSPPLPNEADLSITKTDSPDPVNVGDSLLYTITVTNNGPGNATGVTVTDTLPSGITLVSVTPSQGSCSGTLTVSCSLGNIENGASATVMIVVIPTVAGTICNSASVTGNESDPDITDNTTPIISTTVTVNNPPTTGADLSITKTDLPDPVIQVGDQITYTITVTNNGPDGATGVKVTDTLPNGVTFLPAFSDPRCSETAPGTVECTIGNLSNSSTDSVIIVVSTSTAGMIGNTATVTRNETDPNAANNSATATTNVGDITRLVAISTRARVETGPDVAVGGFSFGGILPKQILIRGRGPSMSGPPYNFAGTLTNPILEVYSGQTLFAVVDNWQSGATQCDAPALSCGTPAEMQAINSDPCQPNIGQTTAPPGCAQEAAFLITVPPGAYTARLKGVNNEMGKGIVEVYDPDTSTMPKVEGISTRAKVLTGTDIMVGGFQIGAGSSSKKVLIRGRGPSLSGAPYNFTGTLANPKLEIYSGQTLFATIDDWGTGVTMCNAPAISCGTPAELQAALVDPCQPNNGQSTEPPGCNLETALFITLPPGAYTAQVKGVDNGIGIGIVEIYEWSQ